MEYNATHYRAPKECRFTYNGDNLTAVRRAVLKKIARREGVDAEGAHVEILERVIFRLEALRRPDEITQESV